MRPPPDDSAVGPSPLVVTAIPAVVDELTRLCAAAGVVPRVATSVEAAMQQWREAPLVLLGSDLRDTAERAPGRSGGAHLVVLGAATESDLRWSLRVGVGRVVELPSAEPWLVERLGDLGDAEASRGVVVGVLGGGGGAGASVLAAAMAQLSARAHDTLLVDLDPNGPGTNQLMGLPPAPAVGWETLVERSGRVAARALREALPARGRCRVLSWQELPAAVGVPTLCDVIDSGARGHALVVLDLPRGWEVPPDVVSRVDLLLVVVRPDLAGLASAGRTLVRCPNSRVVVVLRGSRTRTELLDEVAGVPVLARMTDQSGLTESLDLGFGPLRRARGPLRRTANELLSFLGVGG